MYAATRYPPIPSDNILAPVTGGMRWRRPQYAVLNYGYTTINEEKYEDAEEEGHAGNYRDTPCPRRHREDYISPLCAPFPDPAPVPEPEYEQAPLSPVITTAPLTEARAAESYCYTPKAHDGIATAFTWSLATAPQGMTIDRHTGAITWTPAEGGHYTIRLHTRSVYGAESSQTWTVCVRKAKPKRTIIPTHRYREALRRKATALIAASFPLSPWRQPRRLPAPPRLTARPVDAARSPPTPLRL